MNYSRSFLLAQAVFALVLASPGRADEASVVAVPAGAPLSGKIFTDFYVPTGGGVDSGLQQMSLSLWLQSNIRLNENSSGHFVFTADDFQTSSVPNNSQLRLGVREGYLEYSRSGWEFRAGKMIIPWGKSDVINPTDFLSAKDNTFFNPDEEVRRTGAISFLFSWTPNHGNSPLTFSVIGTPILAQSKLLLAPGQIPSNITLASAAQVPTPSFSNTETAFKISYTGAQWDASLSAFRGWNHTPQFQVTSFSGVSPAVSVSAVSTFCRNRALGGDSSVSFGKWVLRAEAAYVWTENDDGQNPIIQPSHFDSVLGIERPIGDDFRIQVQGFLRYFPQYLDPSQTGGSDPVSVSINRQIAQTNALVQNYQERFRPAGTLRLSYSREQDNFSTELFLVANFIGGDYLVRPQFTYAWTDSLKTTLGVDYYGGPSDRPLGVRSPFNAAYLEARYLF